MWGITGILLVINYMAVKEHEHQIKDIAEDSPNHKS